MGIGRWDRLNYPVTAETLPVKTANQVQFPARAIASTNTKLPW
jgi:hypothetical protein